MKLFAEKLIKITKNNYNHPFFGGHSYTRFNIKLNQSYWSTQNDPRKRLEAMVTNYTLTRGKSYSAGKFTPFGAYIREYKTVTLNSTPITFTNE